MKLEGVPIEPYKENIYCSPRASARCIACGEFGKTVRVKCVVEFDLCHYCAKTLCENLHEILLYDWEDKVLK